MGFIDGIKTRAKSDVKTIVLPESYDMRVIEAASKIEKEGVAKVILIGDPEDIAKSAAGYDLTGVQSLIQKLLPDWTILSFISMNFVREKV